MPITFSVTCDNDEELARFLESFRLVDGKGKASGAPAAKLPSAKPTKPAKLLAKKPGVTKPTPKAKVATPAKPKAKSKTKPKATSSASGFSSRSPRKIGKLTPIIETAIKEITRSGKPFRSREVTKLIMKKMPQLNESSVTTGVSKALSESSLKYELIKDTIGRPYKLYKP